MFSTQSIQYLRLLTGGADVARFEADVVTAGDLLKSTSS